ncbi:hypothetical protein [Flavobacterium sp.]|uniref:hypothetical protein n=1 Tax=Flavobacterium sp. TaxID=239 RepID=UPI00374DCD6C
MQKTVLLSRMITDDDTITLENVTSLRVIVSEQNTQRVVINDIPVLERTEDILQADGTICDSLELVIKFQNALIPTGSPVSQIWIQYRKLKKDC